MEVAAVAVISNRAAGLSAERLTHEDVQLVVGRAADQMTQILKETVIRW
jgi:purine nucleoside phosphorylase